MTFVRNSTTWIFATVLLLISAALALWAATWVREAADWREHSFKVINTSESLLSQLKDAETGERGYLLTGDKSFLAPYYAAVDSIDTGLNELQRLMGDQETQQQRLLQMQPLIASKLSRLRELIELRERGQTKVAFASVASGRGQNLMDEIRLRMAVFQGHEQKLLAQRNKDFDTGISLLILGIVVSGSIAVIIAGTAVIRMRRLGDVTRRRAAFQGTLLDNVNAAIISTTPEGFITSFNRGAEHLLGYRAEEVVRHRTPAVFHAPEEISARATEMSAERRQSITPDFATWVALAREGQQNADEWTFIRKDGSTIPVVLTVSAMQDDQGTLIGYLGIARDIVKRKAAEAQVARSLKELKDFKDALDQHAIVATTDAHGEITYANDKFCAISKYPRQALIGQNHRIINSGYHSKVFFEAMWKTISSGKVWNGEIRNRTREGTFYWVNTTIVPFLNEQGIPSQYIAIRTDITARKEAEMALDKAKTAAELANHTKDSFLATMSHEIRTPLGGLLGMLELLGFTPLNEDQRDTLRAAHDSGRSLLRIVNDILDWSKIEAGKLALDPQPTSLAQLLQSVVNTYARVASAKSLFLEYSVDAQISSAHIVDPLRLSQILNNFVSNALKFTRKGRIEVRAELLTRNGAEEKVRFSVKDTGIGMDTDAQQRLFQNFSQGHADTARMYGGTGLGLAICRRLADLMQGDISFESVPGQGSTFSFTMTLSVTLEPVEAINSLHTIPDVGPFQSLLHGDAPLDAPAVLVVDDHPTNRKLLSVQLGLIGCRAETAENGEMALVLWRSGDYAALITDCHMPQMDGYELTRQIRDFEAKHKHPRTLIVAWTANALSEERARCYAAGMDEVLVKPASLPQLHTALSKYLTALAPLRIVTEHEKKDNALNDAPIDFSELNKLTTNVVEKAEVLREFIAQCRSDITDLDLALRSQDMPMFGRIVHRMKGASRMVGARELAAACLEIESAAQQERALVFDQLQTALERLAPVLAELTAQNARSAK